MNFTNWNDKNKRKKKQFEETNIVNDVANVVYKQLKRFVRTISENEFLILSSRIEEFPDQWFPKRCTFHWRLLVFTTKTLNESFDNELESARSDSTRRSISAYLKLVIICDLGKPLIKETTATGSWSGFYLIIIVKRAWIDRFEIGKFSSQRQSYTRFSLVFVFVCAFLSLSLFLFLYLFHFFFCVANLLCIQHSNIRRTSVFLTYLNPIV